MATTQSASALDPEVKAINTVYQALKPLEPDGQTRVVEYVVGKLGIRQNLHMPGEQSDGVPMSTPIAEVRATSEVSDVETASHALEGGINSIAQKWMKRNALTADQLSSYFSLGGEEIDLIAKDVPGKSKKQRMRSVLLLKAVAAYLGSGAARVSHDQLKETCLHVSVYRVFL